MRFGKSFLWWIQLAIEILKVLLGAQAGNPKPPESAGPGIVAAILRKAVRDNEDDKADGSEVLL